MLREHFINQFNNFIAGWYIDTNLCDSMVQFYKDNPDKFTGTAGEFHLIIKEAKDCTECLLTNEILRRAYFSELQKCVDQYIMKYAYSDSGDPWSTVEEGKIQYYAPGQGYHAWHCERNVCSVPMVERHLVFLTYLNDVTDQGETEFFYQKIKMVPEKGLTIIWPADWTFTHRGIVSPTQEKYIYTGWFNFFKN